MAKFKVTIEHFTYIQEQLSKLFSFLEQGKYQTLMNILYRVDVGEEQIQKAMSETVDEPFSDVIAKLLMKRCLLKVLMKYHFSNQENRGIRRTSESINLNNFVIKF